MVCVVGGTVSSAVTVCVLTQRMCLCFRRVRGGGAAGPEGCSGDGEHPGGAAAELLLMSHKNTLNV